jgi:hypothetical protein
MTQYLVVVSLLQNFPPDIIIPVSLQVSGNVKAPHKSCKTAPLHSIMNTDKNPVDTGYHCLIKI